MFTLVCRYLILVHEKLEEARCEMLKRYKSVVKSSWTQHYRLFDFLYTMFLRWWCLFFLIFPYDVKNFNIFYIFSSTAFTAYNVSLFPHVTESFFFFLAASPHSTTYRKIFWASLLMSLRRFVPCRFVARAAQKPSTHPNRFTQILLFIAIKWRHADWKHILYVYLKTDA